MSKMRRNDPRSCSGITSTMQLHGLAMQWCRSITAIDSILYIGMACISMDLICRMAAAERLAFLTCALS